MNSLFTDTDSLLLLHEYHLKNYSLYDLYLFRNKIYFNNNYINNSLKEKPLKIIDKTIERKSNGVQLLYLINSINNIYKSLENCEDLKRERELKLLAYTNFEKCEKIFNFEKDSLLNNKQKIIKYYLFIDEKIKKSINLIINMVLYCEYNFEHNFE